MFVLSCAMHVLRLYQPHTLPRLSVLAAPFMYHREECCWIPGSLSVLACGNLALSLGVLISRLAFDMLSCWLLLGLLFGLAFGWWCLRYGKIGLSLWLGLTASSFGRATADFLVVLTANIGNPSDSLCNTNASMIRWTFVHLHHLRG